MQRGVKTWGHNIDESLKLTRRQMSTWNLDPGQDLTLIHRSGSNFNLESWPRSQFNVES